MPAQPAQPAQPAVPGPDDERVWRRFGPDSAERAALLALSDHLGMPLRPRAVELRPGTIFEVEGVDPEGRHLVQVIVNRGGFTSQQRNKVLADMFKLLWLKETRFPDSRVGLVLNDNTAEAFRPRSWTSLAAHELGFDLYVLGADGRIAALRPERTERTERTELTGPTGPTGPTAG